METRGSRLESDLDRLLAVHTMRDFLFLRPSVIKGGLLRELCDLLIVLYGGAIPIQLKGQGTNLARTDEAQKNGQQNRLGLLGVKLLVHAECSAKHASQWNILLKERSFLTQDSWCLSMD